MATKYSLAFKNTKILKMILLESFKNLASLWAKAFLPCLKLVTKITPQTCIKKLIFSFELRKKIPTRGASNNKAKRLDV